MPVPCVLAVTRPMASNRLYVLLDWLLLAYVRRPLNPGVPLLGQTPALGRPS